MKTIELAFGVVTLPLAITAVCVSLGPSYQSGLSLDQTVGSIGFFIAPSLLTAVGSYLHTRKGTKRGFVVLWVGGGFLALMLIVYIFGGVFYYGLWVGLFTLFPSVAALITLMVSLFVESSTTHKEGTA